MNSFSTQAIEAAVNALKDPESGRPLSTFGQLKQVTWDGAAVLIRVGLTNYALPVAKDFQDNVIDAAKKAAPEATAIRVELVPEERKPERIGEIGLSAKSVIAIGSGKGGVGKSTIAASLAAALKNFGCAVGLMDADVYGPSIPQLFGRQNAERPEIVDKKIVPVDVEGLKLMSMGFLVPPGEAVVWRGPMLHGAITQFLRDTAWGDLDYLIIDMPPGTGDIALTLSQILPLTGAIVVCTPQEVALIDAVKAIAMFRKVGIPLLGMVENMSYFLCPDNGKRYPIFGHGGARAKAEELIVPFLGEAPIQMAIRERGDSGETMQNLVDHQTAEIFRGMAYRLVKQICDARKAKPPLPTLNVL